MNRSRDLGGILGLQRGVAGPVCPVCGQIADAVSSHTSPGPMAFGSAAQRTDPRPLSADCYTHGRDSCWTAWRPAKA